jgi:hypothetical protein
MVAEAGGQVKLDSLTAKMESLASDLVANLKQGKQISPKDRKFLKSFLESKKGKTK